jgi:hypothetical protein
MLCAAKGHGVNAGFRTPDMANAFRRKHPARMCELLYDKYGEGNSAAGEVNHEDLDHVHVMPVISIPS